MTIYATVGLHPHEARHGVDTVVDLIAAATPWRSASAGSTTTTTTRHATTQRDVFAAQVALAHRARLPLVVHTRDAWDDTFDVLDGAGVPARLVFHCFTGGPRRSPPGARPRGIPQLLGNRHVQERRRRPRRSRGSVPTTGCSSRPTAPTSPRFRIVAELNRPAWVPVVGACLADLRGESPWRTSVRRRRRRHGQPSLVQRLGSRRSGRRIPAPTEHGQGPEHL